MILWAGTSNKDVGMVVEHYPSIILPRRKQEIQQVPGRNGDIILFQDAYENYEQSYRVFLDAKAKGGIEKVIPKISDWLLGHSGYQRLEDSYFPDVYRMAYYTGGVEFVSFFNEYGEGVLTFNCAPEKYYKSGEKAITISKGQVITNPTLFPAKPIVTVKGSGAGTITFGSNSLTISNIGTSVTIDVKDHIAYNGSTNRNSTITGRYENMVLSGKTTITWSGGVTGMTMIPRWWTI